MVGHDRCVINYGAVTITLYAQKYLNLSHNSQETNFKPYACIIQANQFLTITLFPSRITPHLVCFQELSEISIIFHVGELNGSRYEFLYKLMLRTKLQLAIWA